MANVLVVYYSRKGENHTPDGIRVLEKGNTEYAAEYIQKALDADIFEVDTVKPYPTSYRECCMEAIAEARSEFRPEIKSFADDVTKYEAIFVCFPCWCGTAPMCIFTFLEHYDWTGKRIIPLCTNEGSGMANAEKDIINSCKGATVAPGLSVRGHQAKNMEAEISSWARSHIAV